jgi:hypothetical protein
MSPTNPTPSQEGPSAADLAFVEKYTEAWNRAYDAHVLAKSGPPPPEKYPSLAQMLADYRAAHTAAAVEQARAQAWLEYDKKLATQYLRGERDDELLDVHAICEQRDTAVAERDALTRQLAEREKELRDAKVTEERASEQLGWAHIRLSEAGFPDRIKFGEDFHGNEDFRHIGLRSRIEECIKRMKAAEAQLADLQRSNVKVWHADKDGEYGAWQYRFGNTQGGERTLKDALYQAHHFGAPIVVLPEGQNASNNEATPPPSAGASGKGAE